MTRPLSAIKILPEQLANQIAAGEVIERPASVAKELVENAIDAGASQLTVEVEGNGTRVIRIIDDGAGMDPDDVLLCLERHATSKLLSAEQLAAITTLGFRGEAIPSIASVSRLTITSRPAGVALGTMVDVRYGVVRKVHEAGGGQGTVMEVRDLFGNVPARRKFLKSVKTEIGHIEETVKNYGLAYPAIGFNLTVDNRAVLAWPSGVDDLAGRVARLFGRRGGEDTLLTVNGQGSGDELTVRGYLLPPEEAPATGARLRLFVNGRVVKDRMMTHAVCEGLHNFLLKGRSPAGVLLISIAPHAVDVNVHPAKQEVRFRDSQAVHRAVAGAVRQAVVAWQDRRKGALFGRGESAPPKPVSRPEASVPSSPSRPKVPEIREPQPLFRSRPAASHPQEAPAKQPALPSPPPVSRPVVPQQEERHEAPVEGAAQPEPLRLLGQVGDCYILCESAGGLLVVDQHAAHERLLFEELRRHYEGRTIARQRLLFPKVLECTLAERRILEEHGEEIARLGLEIEEFGGASFVVKAVPVLLGRSAPEEVVAGILARFADEGSGTGGQRVEAVLATMACKAAVKAGQRLNTTEMAHLLQKMQEADIFSHCPHGRPVARRFSPDDLKKWFHRT